MNSSRGPSWLVFAYAKTSSLSTLLSLIFLRTISRNLTSSSYVSASADLAMTSVCLQMCTGQAIVHGPPACRKAVATCRRLAMTPGRMTSYLEESFARK